jgi:hypothetical protein
MINERNKMKKLLLLVFLALTISAGAQTPYEVFGHKGKVLKTDFEKGGGIIELINTDSNSAIYALKFDFINMKFYAYDWNYQELSHGEILPTVNKKWWSRDPKASSFPSMSPYSAMNCNPIYIIDPGGDSGFVYTDSPGRIIGDINAHARAYNFTLISTSFEPGRYQIEGTINPDFIGPPSPAEQTLYNMVRDPVNNVNLFALSGVEVFWPMDFPMSETPLYISLGAYGGNYLSPKGTQEALQYLNYKSIDALSNMTGSFYYNGTEHTLPLITRGEVTVHELIEAYVSMKLDFHDYLLSHNESLERFPTSHNTDQNGSVDPSNPNITVYTYFDKSSPLLKVCTDRVNALHSLKSYRRDLIIPLIDNRR